MTRSTILLSLITLFAVGGCNAPSETIEPNSGASSQQSIEQSGDGAATTSPPEAVSQPLESPNADDGPSVVAKAESNSVDAPASSTAAATSSTQTSAKAPAAEGPGSEGPSSEDPDFEDEAPDTNVANDSGDEGSVTVQSAQSGAVDTTIIPGQQFSFVTNNTTYEQLEATVGASQLKTEDVHLGEGIFAPATQVNVGSNQSFTVVWSDESKSTPLEVRDLGTGWKINGIYTGMSFEDLEAALGEFEMLGFGWDYGGTLLLENTSLAPHSGKLFIRVQPSEKAMEGQQEKFTAVLGDASFASSNPNFDALELSVMEMVVRLDQ